MPFYEKMASPTERVPQPGVVVMQLGVPGHASSLHFAQTLGQVVKRNDVVTTTCATFANLDELESGMLCSCDL
jgi:hypothetical protein